MIATLLLQNSPANILAMFPIQHTYSTTISSQKSISSRYKSYNKIKNPKKNRIKN
jgi:hypothetical protein